jgi:hypothetical protein
VEYFYPNGVKICAGDNVTIGPSATGVVVGVIGFGDFVNGHNKDHWADYEQGVLVESPDYGLILYQDPDTIDDLTKTE